MKQATRIVVSLLILTAVAFGDENLKKVDDFTLEALNGKKVSLTDFKDAKAIVIIFIATECPVSNAYNERMAALHQDYKSKGIVFLGINSNKQESVEDMKEHAREHKHEFTILKDWDNVVADKFDAQFTPEVFVLTKNLEIQYHGRIDDSRAEARVSTKDLRNALDEILAGKTVSTTKTKAFGCTIKRVG
jgi:peroxiredoxin